jgi:hypothetical protein
LSDFSDNHVSRPTLAVVRVLLLSVVVVALLVPIAVFMRRAQHNLARLDRHGLDDLRRIYRRDNPRGPGLEPLIRDQQRTGVNRRPRDLA